MGTYTITVNDFIFTSADQGAVVLTVNKTVVGRAASAAALAALFVVHDVTAADEIYTSSTMDFASEAGFATDDGARLLVDAALQLRL
tara:strand:+ start:1464 stop:1724 length:261 start_codon:yes stop_codon:yes gene_type:complete